MPERLKDQSIPILQRQTLLSALPCFSTLTVQDTKALAVLFYEVQYAAGDVITIEEALIDNVYIIVTGEAEVTRNVISKHPITKKNKITKVPVAELSSGEAIGLNDAGFFSTTGKRTATVTALSDMLVLALDIEQLHQFLQEHAHFLSEMYDVTEKMLRMRLIKQSLPFSRLSHSRLEWLASQIEDIAIPAGAVLFRQGDIGDRCYLIRSGQIEIVMQEKDNSEHQLAILKSPTLFGEATLITHSPRNATARAIDNCELLVLRHEHLSELIETERNVADMFMTLMVDRSRPMRNVDITAHPRKTADGQEVIILKNALTGTYFKLSDEGWFIWQELDGKKTLQEITLALAEKFSIFSPDTVAGLISKLAKAGFIYNLEVNEEAHFAAQPIWVRMLLRLRRILEAKIAIGDTDKWITYLYHKGIHLFFTAFGKIFLTMFALAGLFAFSLSTYRVIDLFRTAQDAWILFLLLLPLMMLSVALHELGHAFATKSYGHEVHYMGVGWYWFGPVAFTDTSDMWLSTRGPRIVVNLAGVFADLITASISALLIFVVSNHYVQCLLWLFSLYTYINAFRMLSPLQELDGYYVLMDLFDRPHLRQEAVLWLVKELPKSLRHPSLFRKKRPELFYWISCIIFLVLVSLITLLVQHVIFKMLDIQVFSPFLSLLLPFIVVLISSLGIIADLRSQAED